MYHYQVLNAIPTQNDMEEQICIATPFILNEEDKESFKNTMRSLKKKFPEQQLFDITFRACDIHNFHVRSYNEPLNMQGFIVF